MSDLTILKPQHIPHYTNTQKVPNPDTVSNPASNAPSAPWRNMYQKKSNLQNLIIISIDCLVLVLSLGIANYIRHQKFFKGLNNPMDMKVLIAIFLVVFLIINLF